MELENQILRAWNEAFSEEVLKYSKPEGVSNEEVFADVYHSLIHSPQSATLIQLEHSNAQIIQEKCRLRDQEIKELEARQNQEMSKAIERSKHNENLDDHDERLISRLASQHLEERQMTELRWESDLNFAKETQRREFRQWVMAVSDQIQTKNKENEIANGAEKKDKSTVSEVPYASTMTHSASSFSLQGSEESKILQESFTITLGAQMKQMYNLRIFAADPRDLCKFPSNDEEALPQRLQTSMSLYSNNLSGMIILADSKLSSYSGAARDIANLAESSTESHFSDYDEQIRMIKEEYTKKALNWRKELKKKRTFHEPESIQPDDNELLNKYDSGDSLKNGDIFITRHSNLCSLHVIFHMVSDDSVLSSNINSRHPVVMGLRNVLKNASLSDVTSVTLPLLLTHEMTEAMTVSWCMKRAELVFKCVKGFMMEVSAWGGSDIKTLQFLVPKDIDQDVFDRLTSMLSGIFRTSNPISAKT